MDDDEDDDDMSDTPAIVIRHHKKLVRSHLAPMLKTDVEDRDHQTLISADDIVAVGINEGTTDRPSSTTETHHERANLGIAGRTGSFYEETACCTESDDLELFAA
jgi:hypothetical protein